MEQALRSRIDQISREIPDSIADRMCFQLVDWDEEKRDYTFACRTQVWMRNFAGTLHGGMCATILDQAMGFVASCLKPGPGIAPTVQMEVNYHRPLIPGEEVLVKVHVVSVTRSLMNLTAEAMRLTSPDKVCLSGSGIFFYKPAEDHAANL